MKKTEAIQEVVTLLRQAATDDEMLELLMSLLTVGELEEIARRLQIVRLLKAGVPQREIASRLGVGIATVTRGANELKRGRFSKA